ncbi:unnamed protein product [Mycena citricolor]|uniref:Cyclin N-terminal domain-containing protein n=1 Tax=Mycena citricolor TaxID=2018698 RepID=A0AAD2H156_9AGAR|nr:unnamed protein product [Mycena citricolor]
MHGYDYSSWSPASASSSSSSGSGSPVHAASLVDPSAHSPAMMQLVDVPLSRPVIDYVVDCVAATVDYALSRTPCPPPPGGPPGIRGRRRSPHLAKFAAFATDVLTRAEVHPGTVLVALVYIRRAQPHLRIALREWALERVFLGALVVASKYANDSTLKNVHWALCTGVFGKRDVGRVEREFLAVLDWDLGVREEDVVSHWEGLMRAAYGDEAVDCGAGYSSVPVHVPHAVQAISIPITSPPVAGAARVRNHHRSHSCSRHPSLVVVPIPELEPSSPASSLGSLSPPHTPDVPVDVDTHHHHHSGKLNDLLRVFPLPRHPSFRVA